MSKSEEVMLKSVNLKSILTLIGIIAIIATTGGVWYLTQYRVGRIEEDLVVVKEALRRPSFTVEDFELRSNSFQQSVVKELDRRADWMAVQDEFRLETIKTNAETAASIREIKSILLELKKDVSTIKKN